MTVTDAEVSDADPIDGAAGSSHGLLGRTWELLRANWLVIGLFVLLYRVPIWLVYGTCNVTGAPWCAPGPGGGAAYDQWRNPMLVLSTVLDVSIGAVISTLFVMVLAALWTGRWSRVGKNETRETIAGFSWTMVRRIIGVDVLIFVIGLPLSAAWMLAIARLDVGGNPSAEATSTDLWVFGIIQFMTVTWLFLVGSLKLLWEVAIVVDNLPVWSALRHTWATIVRSPGAVAAALLILPLAQPHTGGSLVVQMLDSLNIVTNINLWMAWKTVTDHWASSWFTVIWSIALAMVSSTLAVGLWLRARDGRIEPAELWRGDGGADVAADSFQPVAQ
jgi:hypothetical protein